MLGFVCDSLVENPIPATMLRDFPGIGEPVVRWDAAHDPGPEEYPIPWIVLPESDLYDIARWQIWAQGTAHPKHHWNYYSAFPMLAAQYWFDWFSLAIERDRVDRIITWGSAWLPTRAAILAAHRQGVPVSCVEWGMFRPRADFTCIVTPGAGYYQLGPEQFTAWQSHETNEQALSDFCRQWRAVMQTKLDMATVYTRIENHFERVWFDQVRMDAAAFWGTEYAKSDHIAMVRAREALDAEVTARGGWRKAHPYDPTRTSTVPPERNIEPSVSIHSVLPQCDSVAVLTSTVGLEAWLYDLPVFSWAKPWYAHEGMMGNSFSTARRYQFLDWLRGYLADVGDPSRSE